MAARLPLPTLLSHVLVAFTIEFDNEFEGRMPHRTTARPTRRGPWLVSLVMWSNCMRFVGDEGVSVRALEALARTPTNLAGMERWGYVVVAPDPADPRPRPPRAEWLVRATGSGRRAREVWRPLFGVIERRWRTRFGPEEIGRLRSALASVVLRLDPELPDCLPILGHGLFSRVSAPAGGGARGAARLTLPALLSRALLAFALEFERESRLSLAIGADVLRVVDDDGVRVRDLPRLSGVSKEAIAMALGVLEKGGVAVVGPGRVARLTPLGRRARDAFVRRRDGVEERWRARFGEADVAALREALEALIGGPLLRGLTPHPDAWRASVPPPAVLPDYPMVLHRGGFPDGS